MLLYSMRCVIDICSCRLFDWFVCLRSWWVWTSRNLASIWERRPQIGYQETTQRRWHFRNRTRRRNRPRGLAAQVFRQEKPTLLCESQDQTVAMDQSTGWQSNSQSHTEEEKACQDYWCDVIDMMWCKMMILMWYDGMGWHGMRSKLLRCDLYNLHYFTILPTNVLFVFTETNWPLLSASW